MADQSFYINKAGPVHDSAYLTTDQVLLSTGAGPSKTGQKNRIAAYSISQSIASSAKESERQGVSVGEVLLADDEDAASSFAIHDDLIVAGANESAASRGSSGDNHHLRTFKMLPTSSDKGDTVVIKKAPQHQIFTDLSIELDDYQKVTKISDDGKYAGLLSSEGLFAVVSVPGMTRLTFDGLDSDLKVVDFELLKDSVWVMTAQEVLVVPYTGDSISQVYTLSSSNAPKDFTLIKLRILSTNRVLIGMNHKTYDYGFISSFKIYKGALLQDLVAHTRSRVRHVIVNTRKPTLELAQLICLTTADGQVMLYDSAFEKRKTWKGLHQFPVSTAAFRPDGKQMITASIDERINVLDLHDLRPPTTLTQILLVVFSVLLMMYLFYALRTGKIQQWMMHFDYWIARQHRRLADY